MGVNDFGTAGQTTAVPSLADWAGSVAAALDNSDVPVNTRIATHNAATTGVHGIGDTAALVLDDDPRLSDARPPTGHTHPAAQISDSTTVGRAVVTAADAAAARTAIGAAQAGAAPATHAASHSSAGSDPVTVAESQVTGLTAALAAKAPLASPALTGVPTAPTAAQGTATTQVATTAHVATEVGLLVPKALYDANSLVVADSDNTPKVLSLPASSLVGRGATGNIAALSPATVRSDFDLAQLSTVGNLLTANQATPTTGVLTLSGCTEASGVVLTASGSGAYTAAVSGIAVTVGQVYTVHARLAPTGRAVATRISWRNSGGSEISAVTGDTVAVGTTGNSMATGVAPATAVTMIAYLAYASTGSAGDAVTVTKTGAWLGAGGGHSAPGTPIADLGTKVSHPNTDDVLVQQWDSSKATPGWQTIHYDSGWRGVVAALSPLNCSITYAYLRRVNSVVTFNWSISMTALNNNPRIGAMPSGFVPSQNFDLAVIDQGGVGYASLQARSGTISLYKDTNLSSGSVWRQLQTWQTNDAIPTSLPGTLVSAAPA